MGRIRRTYVKEQEGEFPVSEETMESKTKNGIIANSSYVNLRSRAEPHSIIESVMTRGTRVKVLEDEKDGYYKIQTDTGSTGYVLKEYCEVFDS